MNGQNSMNSLLFANAQPKSILPNNLENVFPNITNENAEKIINRYLLVNNLTYPSYENLMFADPIKIYEKKNENKAESIKVQIMEEKLKNMENLHYEEKARLLAVINSNMLQQQENNSILNIFNIRLW
jgi:hypothetical protein